MVIVGTEDKNEEARPAANLLFSDAERMQLLLAGWEDLRGRFRGRGESALAWQVNFEELVGSPSGDVRKVVGRRVALKGESGLQKGIGCHWL